MTKPVSRNSMSMVWACVAIPFIAGCANVCSALDSSPVCATMYPGPIQKAAKAMVGQPISVAFKAFGRPFINHPPLSQSPESASYNGNYFWDNSRVHVSPNLSFVQTGSQYTGSHMVGVTRAGDGHADIPVYQDDYQATGYYDHETVLDTVCMITIKTNHADIITKVDVSGCRK
ncbi:hypothetical protein [Burkholderia lata]|uniref:Lipoprotein n=1 Tax=Burkholderia lata (strain ATCC 17760 / DSM 23089 / LMG 22485 / NCIMB 9086 / R18194 / 383) TaxID=482957 RepID=A0A6P2TQF2_BURL3|nr:hypothetical protein [Burkholderia lata]VWC59946.1 hypothetical protein BLA18109_01409 [Burkholderia lata]